MFPGDAGHQALDPLRHNERPSEEDRRNISLRSFLIAIKSRRDPRPVKWRSKSFHCNFSCLKTNALSRSAMKCVRTVSRHGARLSTAITTASCLAS